MCVACPVVNTACCAGGLEAGSANVDQGYKHANDGKLSVTAFTMCLDNFVGRMRAGSSSRIR